MRERERWTNALYQILTGRWSRSTWKEKYCRLLVYDWWSFNLMDFKEATSNMDWNVAWRIEVYWIVSNWFRKLSINHGRSKHVERKFHFLRDQVNKHSLELYYCKTELQVANIQTKPLKKARFDDLNKLVAMECLAIMN